MHVLKKLLGAIAIGAALVVSGCAGATAPQQDEPVLLDGTSAEDLNRAVAQIRTVTDFEPLVGIVLGSGLGGLADEVEVVATIDYAQIEGFPVSTVEGHEGQYIFGYLRGVPVVLMDGRVHYYEGYSMKQVVLPVCTIARLGADTIILTNAAGSLNPEIQAGTLMCIEDQISSFVPSPLIGENDPELGPRFTDMSQVYDAELQESLHGVADRLGIPLSSGVYLQVTGPCYETPAESQLYASLGADAVGMSTAVEATALHHMGVRVVGISCIANIATLDHDITVTHEEVQESVQQASGSMIELVSEFVVEIAGEG